MRVKPERELRDFIPPPLTFLEWVVEERGFTEDRRDFEEKTQERIFIGRI